MPNGSDAAPNSVRKIRNVQKFTVGADFEAYAEQLEFFFRGQWSDRLETEESRPVN